MGVGRLHRVDVPGRVDRPGPANSPARLSLAANSAASTNLILHLLVWMVAFVGAANLVIGQDGSESKQLEASPLVLSNLERIDELVANQQWDDAVESIRNLMENDGSSLVTVFVSGTGRHAGFRRSLAVRDYCHLKLARWSVSAPAALAAYRELVDPLAQRWLDEGLEKLEEDKLQRIVDELFTSRAGDDALFHLGELALRRGDPLLARTNWERIYPRLRTPPANTPVLRAGPGRPLWLGVRNAGVEDTQFWKEALPLLERNVLTADALAYPDSGIPVADVLARLCLTSVLEGNRERAATELLLLRKMFPDATGKLAGKSGNYASLLDKILNDSREWPWTRAMDWNTFAGAPSRQPAARYDLDVELPPVWQIPLPPRKNTSDQGDLLADQIGFRIGEESDGLLPYHPVVVGKQVFVPQANGLRAVGLTDGQPLWAGNEPPTTPSSSGLFYAFPPLPNAEGGIVGVHRYTLTAADNKLYATTGAQARAIRFRRRVEADQNRVVGLNLRAGGKMLNGFPLKPEGPDWSFAGPPVVVESRLFVVTSNSSLGNNHSQFYLNCYSSRSGKLIWQRRLDQSQLPLSDVPVAAQEMLTFAHGLLFYQTNAGRVFCFRASDGQPQWAFGYPTLAATDFQARWQRFRDLSPPLYHRGLLYIAPPDCEQLFCLDAGTGQLVWASRPDVARDALHLLGVSRDHLLMCGEYLYWINAYTGELDAQFPEPQALEVGRARNEIRGYGRGLITGTQVYWPTRESLLIFSLGLAKDEPATPNLERTIELEQQNLRGGNLILTPSGILVASHEQLYFLADPDKNATDSARKGQ